jgi:hypothetical protein
VISIMFRRASDDATLAGGPAFGSPTSPAPATANGARVPQPRTAKSSALVGPCSPGSREQVRGAAYDAVEKVLNGLFQPLSPQVLMTRWNDAADAMAKHLETNYIGPE